MERLRWPRTNGEREASRARADQAVNNPGETI